MLINLINHLTIYRACIAHQKEPIYGLSRNPDFFKNSLNMAYLVLYRHSTSYSGLIHLFK